LWPFDSVDPGDGHVPGEFFLRLPLAKFLGRRLDLPLQREQLLRVVVHPDPRDAREAEIRKTADALGAQLQGWKT
jgi:hypothetical protein